MAEPYQPINIPSPRELVGNFEAPSQSAISALIDSYRKGLITADDIAARASTAAKRKAELTLANEAVTPEAAQARQLQREAQNVQAQVSAAQGRANLPLIEPSAQLAQMQLARQQAYMQYPAAQLFDQYAPMLGLSEPRTPEGQPDWAKKAEIGARIALRDAERKRAEQELNNYEVKFDDKARISYAVDKRSGQPIDPEHVQTVINKSRQPLDLAEIQPGTVVPPATAPATIRDEAPAPMITQDVNKLRAQAINSGQLEAGAGLSDEEVLRRFGTATAPVIEARTTGTSVKPEISPAVTTTPPAVTPVTTPTTPPLGQRVGGGFSMGPVPKEPAKLLPSEGVTKLTLADQAADKAIQIDNALKELLQKHPEAVGFISGRVLKWVGSPQWNADVARFKSKTTSILAPVAKGTYNETGVLSDKDVARYESVIPALTQDPKVALQLSRELIGDVSNNFGRQVDFWRRAGYDTSQFDDVVTKVNAAAQAQLGAEPSPTAAPTAAAPTNFITTSSGQKLAPTSVPGYFILQK